MSCETARMLSDLCVSAFDDLCALPFKASVWGTAGQWMSSILTAGSLLLAWYVILRDHRKEERQHALKAVCWLEDRGPNSGILRDAHFVNTSEQPITRPRLVLVPKPRPTLDAMNARLSENMRILNLDRTALLTKKFPFKKEDGSVIFREDEAALYKGIIPEMPLEMYDSYLIFFDASGQEWAKTVPGGRVIKEKKLVAINKRIKELSGEWKKSAQLQIEIAELMRDKTEDKRRAEEGD